MENNLIDFNHWLGSEIGNQLLSNAQEAKWLQTVNYLNPKFGKDGNQFYYIIGAIEQPDCIVGFGDTPHAAMVDFCRCFENVK
jgi:hypothetical protein